MKNYIINALENGKSVYVYYVNGKPDHFFQLGEHVDDDSLIELLKTSNGNKRLINLQHVYKIKIAPHRSQSSWA